jgi:foldase protein PrsA
VKLFWAAICFSVLAVVSGCNSNMQPPAGDSGSSASSTQPPAQVSSPPAPTPAQPAAAAASDPVIAKVRGDEINMSRLEGPLVEAYGLNVLLYIVQLDLAEQDARARSIVVTQQDIDDETGRTLIEFRRASGQEDPAAPPATQPSDLDPSERHQLLSQLLTGDHITEPEFELTMETNAYLRKLVAPEVQGGLTDERVRDRFNALYGEKTHIRFIKVNDMMAVAKIQQDLKAGRSFEDEARLHAYDSLGHASAGELPPFTRKDVNYPPTFREVAFELKPKQISDPVQIGDAIYLIQSIELIPPQHANFDEYKDSVRQDLYDQDIRVAIGQYRRTLGEIALETMEIKDPVLRKQWDARLAEKTQDLRDAEALKKKFEQQTPTQPTTNPGQ